MARWRHSRPVLLLSLFLLLLSSGVIGECSQAPFVKIADILQARSINPEAESAATAPPNGGRTGVVAGAAVAGATAKEVAREEGEPARESSSTGDARLNDQGEQFYEDTTSMSGVPGDAQNSSSATGSTTSTNESDDWWDVADGDPVVDDGLRRVLASSRGGGGSKYPLFSKCNAMVGKDGSSQYKSVQDAVNKIPGSRSSTWRICIKPGRYNEQVHIKPGQNKVDLRGAGRSTIISAGNAQSKRGSPWYAATLVVEGNDFSAAGFVVENTAKTTFDPAPAVGLLGSRSRWSAMGLIAWVDTVGAFTGKHLFQASYISGLTDVIWGFGRVAIVDSQIDVRHYESSIQYIGYLTAMGTDWPTGSMGSGGAIISKSTINGNGKAYLGRPYRDKALVVYDSCYMDKAVVPVGWSDWQGRYSKGGVQFKEYNSRGPGSSPGERRMSSVSGGSVPSNYNWKQFIA
ncbi:hypothetical protein CLOM_g13976 [Closterium sp. NIES-68]|nr:hypothetical protein CLOM_g13976 [Closterium sp. NIES-68]GJP85810.1 hypothetical protein CLOP_g15908 [Closterium sp. NIES-67]